MFQSCQFSAIVEFGLHQNFLSSVFYIFSISSFCAALLRLSRLKSKVHIEPHFPFPRFLAIPAHLLGKAVTGYQSSSWPSHLHMYTTFMVNHLNLALNEDKWMKFCVSSYSCFSWLNLYLLSAAQYKVLVPSTLCSVIRGTLTL